MKSNKGQALVEFAIILPITLILIFTIIDFGRIITLKNDLQSVTSDVVTFYQNGKEEAEIKNIINENRKDKLDIIITVKGEYATVSVSKKIKPITPGLSYISDSIFNVSVSRVIRNE